MSFTEKDTLVVVKVEKPQLNSKDTLGGDTRRKKRHPNVYAWLRKNWERFEAQPDELPGNDPGATTKPDLVGLMDSDWWGLMT